MTRGPTGGTRQGHEGRRHGAGMSQGEWGFQSRGFTENRVCIRHTESRDGGPDRLPSQASDFDSSYRIWSSLNLEPKKNHRRAHACAKGKGR